MSRVHRGVGAVEVMTFERERRSGRAEVAVRRWGSGPPLVLIHGGFVDSRCWSAVLPALASQYTVVTVDRRGHGNSPAYTDDHTLDDDIADLVDVLATIGEPVTMFAHSAGCQVALGAVLNGAGVHHVVLYEAPTFRDPPITAKTWRRMDAAVARQDRAALVEMMLNDVVGRFSGELTSPEALRGLLSTPFGAMFLDNALSAPTELHALEAHTWTDRDLRALATPTTVVVGGQSPPFNRRFSDRLVGLGVARLDVLPDADHGTPLMDPGVVLTSINHQ